MSTQAAPEAPAAKTATVPDVCLVLEGTYPFVTGGVSSWVHTLVRRLSHLTFGVLHVSPHERAYPNGSRYTMPPNVLDLQEVYLQRAGDRWALPRSRPEGMDEVFRRFARLVDDLRHDRTGAFEGFVTALEDVEDRDALRRLLLQSPESWRIMLETYAAEATEESFLHFFWTWRFALLPLLNILTADVPPARCYHTISTGYAGMLAAVAAARMRRPMMLTEHGIYAKERRIEIQRAGWIPETDDGEPVAAPQAPYFKRFWMRQFAMMSRTCYRFADEILTLYAGNRDQQIRDGADPARVRIVPNGIDLSRFAEAYERHAKRPPSPTFNLGFIGRVCPIKDIRTLLFAVRLVADEHPDMVCQIMGPYDEDPEYAEDCRHLAVMLGLQDTAFFRGPVDVKATLPELDLVVLSSISEAQPLVILEAGAVGVPIVATDVGSCEELLTGRTPEDQKIGPGGLVAPIATPGGLARAILELIRDPERRTRMGQAIRERVRTFYSEQKMIDAYAELYERHAAKDGA